MFNHKSKNNTEIVAGVVAVAAFGNGNGNFSAKTRSDSAQKRVK